MTSLNNPCLKKSIFYGICTQYTPSSLWCIKATAVGALIGQSSAALRGMIVISQSELTGQLTHYPSRNLP